MFPEFKSLYSQIGRRMIDLKSFHSQNLIILNSKPTFGEQSNYPDRSKSLSAVILKINFTFINFT